MRVPILQYDLPKGFNKVAKYLGRHWPTGKLPLSQSRECLAFLLGYNSVHEMHKVSEQSCLPKKIEIQSVYASMAGRALYRYGLNPTSIARLLHRAPFKELSFYQVTDAAAEQRWLEQMRRRGIFPFFDEMNQLNDYKSPKLILEQGNRGAIPKYSYAVRPDGMVFSASDYESLVNMHEVAEVELARV